MSLDYIITLTGTVVVLFSLSFMWRGKKIDDDKEQLFEFHGIKLHTSKIIFILVSGLVTTAFPLIIKESKQTNTKLTAEEKCKSLTGSYTFFRDARYVFTSDDFTKESGIRATATGGSWDDVHCKQANAPDTYDLVGIDTSTHIIEVRMRNGEYKHIGTATAKYRSRVRINNDGTFGARRLIKEVRGNELHMEYDLPEYEKQFEKEIKLYDSYRKKVHLDHQSPSSQRFPCIVAEGYDNSEIVLAFACRNYTRTMLHK